MAKEKYELLITSAVMIGGAMVLPGKGAASCVTLGHSEARNLLDRGKAEVLTEENKPEPENAETDEAGDEQADGDEAANAEAGKADDETAGGDETTKAKAGKAGGSATKTKK